MFSVKLRKQKKFSIFANFKQKEHFLEMKLQSS